VWRTNGIFSYQNDLGSAIADKKPDASIQQPATDVSEGRRPIFIYEIRTRT
jgi:hypothetical protein